MAHNDTPWIGLEGTNTLYLQSGQFNATVKTSLQIASVIDVPQGISWDGVDTPISGRNTGDTVRKLYITSGQFTSTIKDSEDVSGSSVGLQGISIDLTNVPWADQGAGPTSRLVLQSGQISSTIKTSQSVSAVDGGVEGISYDGTNTPWSGEFNDKLYLTSGQFTSTIKDSEDVSGVTSEVRGMSYDGTNTIWAEHPLGISKLFLQSGQFTATIKASLGVTAINTDLADVSTNAVTLSCDTSGTMISPTPNIAAIVAGGRTLLLTLNTGRLPPNSDTWHADIGSNNSRTDDLLAGIVSGGSEANGWNNEVTPLLTFAEVVRTSDSLVTITMPAVAAYSITIPEIVTITIPSTALTGASGPLVALPAVVIELAAVIDDTPWCGFQANKLYLQSNTFTSTLKTSEDVSGIVAFAAGISFDGVNTPWAAISDQWLILTSGQFSATVKTSTDVSSIGNPAHTSSTNPIQDTPITVDGPDKLFLLSGQFTATIKDSEDVSAIDDLVRGISDDGTNTPWCGARADKLYLQSGQFSSTLKTSEDVSGLSANPNDISFRSGDTPWASTGVTVANKLFLQSGQFTSTVKDSEIIFTIDSSLSGMDHDARFAAGGALALNVVPSDADITEQEIRDGGISILLGLSGETWVATVGADNPITQALIDGMLSAFGEARGWNNIVRDGLTAAQVTRNADTLVTVTLPAFASYEITADEEITVTAPGIALTGGVPIVGTPSFSISADPSPPAPRRVVRAKYDNSEWESYISPDGIEYPFHTPHNLGRWVISQTGWGTPPIEYITQRGPFQHGVTVKDFFLQPRVIQLLIRQAFCDRDEWWDGRAALLNEIRPNRQTISTAVVPGRLQRCLPDGTLRAVEVFISDGPRFEQRVVNTWDEWAFQEVLRFVAHNPVIFDPTRNDVNFTIVLDGELVFPITFPIEFGPGEVDDTLDINYVGTWESLPIIVITGPIEQPRIDNLTTGEKLEFSIDVDPGQVVTVDLSYGSKTVLDQDGNNLIGGLTADSDLATFHIAPEPEAPLGVNQMRLQGMHATGVTDIEIRYFDRYFGI